MIKFEICDDEPIMVQEISNHLAKYMKERQIASYCVNRFLNGNTLLLLEAGNLDLIFLDIQMEAPDGMETAKILRQQRSHSLLIFVTILKEYVFSAFEVEAFDYLVKPLDGDRFRQTMDRALRFMKRVAQKTIIVQRGNSCEVISLAEIVYCEVIGRKIYIHKNDGTIINYYNRLEDLEHQVDGRFFKCHRSYLVNLDYVQGCQTGQVILPRAEAIPVSRLREKELLQNLLLYMKERNS